MNHAKHPLTQQEIIDYLDTLHFLNDSSDDDLFFWDLKSDRFYFSGPVHKKYRLPVYGVEGYGISDLDAAVCSRDLLSFHEHLRQIRDGDSSVLDGEYRLADLNGATVWASIKGRLQFRANGHPGQVVGRISGTLSGLNVDLLTGLFNTGKLTEDLDWWLNRKTQGFLILFNINHFKQINTKYGRAVGNHVLKHFSDILDKAVDPPFLIYHLDGDLFAVNVHGCGKEQAESLFNRVQKTLAAQNSFPGYTVSAGASWYGNGWPKDGSTLILYGENALDHAKKSDRDNLYFFSPDNYRKSVGAIDLLDEMRHGIQDNFLGFYLCYQPKIDSKTYEICGAEALLRYRSPSRKTISPEEFVPILEQTELICTVGQWVLRQALEQCRRWRAFIPHFYISVNISYVQLRKKDITDVVLKILKESGLPGNALTLEVTESMQLQNYQYFNKIFCRLNSAGIQISIDDFGTGYSSLSYLKSIEINETKIDRCFISRIQNSAYNYRLLSNIIELAHIAKIQVCCEGVETADELKTLEGLHPDTLQGFYFARPYEAEQFEKVYLDKTSPSYQGQGSFQRAKLERILEGGVLPKTEEIRFVPGITGSMNSKQSYRDILQSTHLGLWVIRIDEANGRNEMYIDQVMGQLMSLPEDTEPTACYSHWYSRINDGYYHYVGLAVESMIQSGHMVQMEYTWNHPRKGEVVVSCSGIRVEDSDGMICLEGYHSISSDVKRPRFLPDGSSSEMFEYNERKRSIYFHTGRSLLAGGAIREDYFPECWIDNEMVHPHFAEEFRSLFIHVQQQEEVNGFELLLKTKSGSYEWFKLKTRHLGLGQKDANTIVILIDPAGHERTMELEYMRKNDFYKSILSETAAYAEVDVESGQFMASGGLWESYQEESRQLGETFSQVMLRHVKNVVLPEFLEPYRQLLSTEHLMAMYQEGDTTRKLSFQRQIGHEYRWVKLVVHIFKEHFSENMYALLYLKDIDVEKRQALAQENAANHDPLTNALNRRTFEQKVISHMTEEEDATGALVVLDLDHFKTINDTYGHLVGDQALQKLTRVLIATFRRHDLVGRFGGDEFLVFIKDVTDRQILDRRMAELYQALAEPNPIAFTCSAGIVMVLKENFSYDETLKKADQALYQSKVKGRATYTYYEDL